MFKKSPKLLFFWLMSIFLILILSTVFYWFEYRPSKIRQECSWVQKHQDATAYIPAKTENELKEEGTFMDCSKISTGAFKDFCEHRNKSFGKEVLAQPARDWYEKATTSEYEFCIKSKGLNK